MQTTTKKVTRTAAIRIAKKYIEWCNNNGLPIRKAILFGSIVKGNAEKNSDIDLLLVSDRFIADSFYNWKMLAPVTAKYFDIEPHPYPTKNFLKGDPFLSEVLKTGIEIKA
jgi:uncharacterized protein